MKNDKSMKMTIIENNTWKMRIIHENQNNPWKMRIIPKNEIIPENDTNPSKMSKMRLIHQN